MSKEVTAQMVEKALVYGQARTPKGSDLYCVNVADHLNDSLRERPLTTFDDLYELTKLSHLGSIKPKNRVALEVLPAEIAYDLMIGCDVDLLTELKKLASILRGFLEVMNYRHHYGDELYFNVKNILAKWDECASAGEKTRRVMTHFYEEYYK